jgi:hypothetical protein
MSEGKTNPPRRDLIESLLLIALGSAALWMVVSVLFFALGTCIEFTSPWCAPKEGAVAPSHAGLGRALMLLLGVASVSLSAGTAIAWAIMTLGRRRRSNQTPGEP